MISFIYYIVRSFLYNHECFRLVYTNPHSTCYTLRLNCSKGFMFKSLYYVLLNEKKKVVVSLIPSPNTRSLNAYFDNLM